MRVIYPARLMLVIAILTLSVCLPVRETLVAHADSIIYIKSDGSIDPPTAGITRTGDLYTLTADMSIDSGIVIERDNMTLDGVEHALLGATLYQSKGISLSYRVNVTIANVEIRDYTYGIWLERSSNNTIRQNRLINNNDYGIFFGYVSTNNLVVSNFIEQSNYGIYLWLSSDNTIYYNVFNNNSIQAGITFAPVNIWDNGSIFGGNYWSDFAAKYPNATQIDASGIWDTPYAVDSTNVDRYPMVNPPVVPEFSSFLLVVVFVATTIPLALIWRERRKGRS
jgi:parallel beta-helix repeat protein